MLCGEARRECWGLTIVQRNGVRGGGGNGVGDRWRNRGPQAKSREINVDGLVVEYVC